MTSTTRSRRTAATKRPLPEASNTSSTLASSPYFGSGSGKHKRPRKQNRRGCNDDDDPVDDCTEDGNNDDARESNNDSSSSPPAADRLWLSTNEIPLHLIGNKYFDDDDDDDDDNGRNNNTNKTNRITLLRRTSVPGGFSLSQSICSYGYFCLAPNRWVPCEPNRSSLLDEGIADANANNDDFDNGYLVRPLTYETTPEKGSNSTTETALVAIGQDVDPTSTTRQSVILAIQSCDDGYHHHPQLTAQIDRMLRLDTCLEGFHSVYPEAGERGFGRLYRSPTLFEDMVKTITNCNMKWGGTVEMNAKLCRHVGRNGAFPTPSEIHGAGEEFLKENCRVGYRARYIWGLARDVVEGTLDLDDRELFADNHGDSLSSSSHGDNTDTTVSRRREATHKRLLKVSGIGPFAANNILQLMGYFDTHPYDTETVRLWKEDFGAPKSATKTAVFAQARLHYARYENYSFAAYWYDLWKNYERRAGCSSPLWSIEQCENERPAGVGSDHNSVFANPPSSASSGTGGSRSRKKNRTAATTTKKKTKLETAPITGAGEEA